MAKLIAEQNPNVSILSIKALGADGTGDVSAVYAAIRYAIDKKVSVINLSMSAVATAENAALTSIIDEATAAGIAVVGAAGNKGMDVRFFVPGNIESAYIIGAADENGARITSSNYGSTVDFNVYADSTSEAAAKFSGYYTVNGAVADEKLVFPTDYRKPEVNIDFNGPIINHQISYYNYEGSSEDLVWVSQKTMKTVLDEDYITTYIGFAEDADLVSKLNVYVDFMSIDSEHAITDECIVDLEKMTVKIPASYKNANLTVRWFMPNASYSYGYDVDAKYMISNTPEKFKAAYNAINGLNTKTAQQYVAGTYAKGFTHAANSMNHSDVKYSTDGINAGDWFTIQSGHIASVEEYPGTYTTRGEIASMFGPTALANLTPAGSATTQTFLSHFNTVTRDSDGSDVSGWFNTVGGKGNGVIHVDVNNSGNTKDDAPLSAGLGWVFGTCANDEVGGQCPSFTGGKIICTSKDPDGTAYFFFYCTSPRGQWTGGSFSITPKLPKTGFLKIHKSSADPKITNGNSCYNFEGIPYGIFTDKDCVNNLVVLPLGANGYSQPYELTAGTYYVREAEAKPGSGYQTNGTVYTVNVTAGTTADAPVMCETTDVPLNDPFGIVINKINSDGTTTADLSGAEYTIKYYAGQYTSVATLPANATYTWVIKTVKNALGNYSARLDDEHIVSGSAVYGKTSTSYNIPLGTITVQETKAPAGFTTEGATVKSAKTGASISGTNGVFLFNLVDENSAVYLKSGNALSTEASADSAMTLTYSEVQNRAGIKVVKYDIAKKDEFETWDGPQGLASLKGIRFAIINNNGGAVKNSAGTLVPDGGVMQVLTTDDNGYAATGTTDLPTGKYIVKELRKDATVRGTTLNEGTSALANDTYMWADNSADVVLTDNDKNSLKWAPAFYNSPVSAVPKFEKHDLELGKKAPMAGTSMAGITYGIYNDSDHPIKINGKTYKKDEVIQRIVADKDGNFTFTTALPYGHYYVKEGGNLHYLGSTTKHYFHVICKDGKGAIFYEKKPGGSETDRYDSVFFSNRVIRGNVSLTKKNGETDETLAYIPFKITNNKTGETHYILTGADGSYTSATGKTTNTNANDAVLSKYGENDVIPQSVIDSLTKDAGLWFGLGSEGTITTAKNSYGALVYGTYTITELKTEATTSMDMYSTTFEVKNDGKLIELGTIKNYPVGIQTTLADANGSHTVEAGKSVTLTDHVAYKNLDTTKKYTLTGTLYAKDNDNLTKLMEKTVEFTPAKENGTQDVTFTFDASNLVGKSVVCFEELFLNGELRASHKDKNDRNQTVTFPSVDGTPVMEKHDLELNKKAAMGGTSFEGITFEIYNDSDEAVLIGGHSYQKGELIATAASDAAGTITTDVKFPVGRYSMKEKSVNSQYTLTDGESHTFTVSYQDGKAVVSYESGANAVIFKDRVVRGDLSLVKKNAETGKKLAYIPFKITNNATGETHYILTGADGSYTSATGKTTNTNANDAVLAKYGENDVIPQSVIDSLTKDAGLWFGLGSEGTMTKANNSYGALVYGTYTITELRTEATKGMQEMYSSTFTIEKDAKTVDLGEIKNVPMGIGTTLSTVSGSHYASAAKSVTLIDHVSYTNLDTTKTYTLKGSLYEKSGQSVKVIKQETVTLKPKQATGTQDVTFTFDASGLKGKVVFAGEVLELDGKLCAEHMDASDLNQTVFFPDVQTTALDGSTNDHISVAGSSVTITDTITYSGLCAGETYRVVGTLMNQRSGKAIEVNGKPVTSEANFTPKNEAAGTVDIKFTFDASSLEGSILVAYEKIYKGTEVVASHTDINDVDQSVSIPKIHTNAKDAVTKINHTEAKPQATIIDTVSYSNLLPGKEYTMTGKLMNKATGKAILINGKEITASTAFTAKKSSGSVQVVFEFDASALEGTTVVAYESLIYKGVEVAVHADITDKDQTVYIPKVRTTAVNQATNDHTASASPNTIITDTVSYSGLEVGKSYEVQGVLMNRKTQKAIEVNGKQVTASATFTAKASDGTVDLTFTFDASALSGVILVAFETLYTQGKEVAAHTDINDEEQTIYFLGIRTTARDNVTGLNQMEATPNATLIDEVAYTSLLPNKEYTLLGVLMNKETGRAVEVNGKQVTATTTFTPQTSDGTASVVFNFDASAVEGITTVVYEYLSCNGNLLASHMDINDAGQTVYIPKIRTSAVSTDTQDHVTKAAKEMHLVDTVSYTGLEVGREYKLQAVLMDRDTNKPVQVGGKNVTSSLTFTPEKTNGTVEVHFDFDGSSLTSNALVVFETMYTEGKEVAAHADIHDEEQTIYIIGIKTHARDFNTQINHTESKELAQIVDHVEYTSVLPGNEYVLYGVLMNKATGKPLLIDGKKVLATTTFTPTESAGSVDVVFKFDASAIEGSTVVVFETLTYRGVEVASHQDIDDAEQTVYIPSVKTTAISGDTKDHMTIAKGDIEITDTVEYKGLEVGRSYVLKGVLMNRNTNVPVAVDGKNIVAETKFTAKTADGTVDVTFKFDGSKLKNTIFVAFETLYADGKEVAAHTDLYDEEQTVYVPEIQTSAKDAITEINHTEAQAKAKIVDTVTYSALLPGKEYTLTGTLMNKATGKAIEIGGKKITASRTFTPTEVNGTVDVTFTFDASVLEGSTVVVFERLTHKGIEVATHEDITDADQTVYIPKIRTTAVSDDTKDHITEAKDKIRLTDTVHYTNLETGRKYELRATLMDQATGNAIVVNGKKVTAFTSFTPDQADGTVDVTFIFDATGLEDRIFVVFERLYAQGKEVAAHADLSDKDQSIYVPKIRTNAADKETMTNHIEAKPAATIVDTVSYSSLLPGKEYTLTGTLMNKATGKAIEVGGKRITAIKTFTPTEANGTVDVTFTFDASALEGTTIVAFEKLLYKDVEVAVHADITDKKQTIYIPKIRTTAISADTKDHVTMAGEKITLVDTVTFESLEIGRTYKVSGVLMDRDTKKPLLDASGKEITSSTEFIAKSNNGTVDVTFKFSGANLASKTIVAYETLYTEGKQIAIHTDINDEAQALYIPTIKTKALDANTGLNQIHEDTNATIVDTVSFDHLLPGRTYVIKGLLMTSTGNALQIDGKPIATSAEFTPKTASGTAEVIFTFDASEIGGRKIVVFEYLYLNDVLLASHTDIKDDNQTLYIPDIKTTIQDGENGSHSSTADEKITLVDTVTYKGLEIGRTYSIEGTLVEKNTGAYILDDAGNKITASTEFTAKKANGTVDVVFKFPGASMAGKIVVAYERLYTEGIEVAAHTNLRDEGQTQYIPSVHTTAIAKDTQDHVTGATEDVVITDEVVLEGLKAGVEYVLRGTLMNAETGQAVIINARTVTAERTFTANANKMTIPLTYALNASELAGTTTVVFESLYSDGIPLVSHADLTDAEQTVYIPKIHTTAKDKITGINHTESAKTATIVDTVFYTNLLPNRSYVVSGKLMNKATGKPILIGGKEVTASTTFTPTKAEGSVDVTFTFDATAVAPETIVVFENLTYKNVELAVHADIEDTDQTVYVPTIKTSAIGDDTKDHVTEAKKDVTIVDTVSYEGLEVGREYTVKGVLMNKATGKAITVNGKEVTASSTFTAKAQKGKVDVTFKFDGSALEDTLLVAFETLYTENREVGVHADIKDDAQTVYLPKIRTHAKDTTTEIDHTEALEKAAIIDTVTYSSLLPGKEYTIKGTLMNKETGKAVLINGEPITAETTFTAEKSSGSVDLTFTFDASAIAGTTVVAFESVEYKGIEVGVHADITDEDQTVYIPDVHTTATALDTKDHVTKAYEEVTITDEVKLTGLKAGSEYTVKGVLMDQTTGKELKVNDELIIAEVTFTADERDMTVTLTYTLDASKLAGTTTVVYETLYTEGREVGKHHEIKDEGQTVYIPEIHTTAKDLETKINHTEAKDKATIVDTVLYSHLLPGKEYTVKGTLMNKATGEPILINDEPITAETTFTPETPDGSVDVIFTFDATAVVPTTIVAFEHLEYKGIEVAVHADITDKDQTVYVPSIHTTAVGEDTKDHVTGAKEETTIVDTVAYKGLEAGREYRLEGILMDQETGEPLLVNDEKVTAETVFTPEEQDGTATVIFTFNIAALAGKTLVVFETLYADGKEVAVHAEIKDEGQTVYIPEIRTTAADKETKINQTEAKKEVTIIDTVLYSHLLPGKEYTVKGTLMNKATGEPILIDGKEITAETAFTAEKADGSVDVIFTFDASGIAGTTIVAFETLEYKGIEVAVHADIEDKDQTVYVPDIHTTAVGADTKDHIEKAKEEAVIVDTVAYKGLEIGREYTLKGILMDKETGEPLVINEKEAAAETTFTPETTDGSIDVVFTIDASALAGKTCVAFETLYTEGKEVAVHTDIEDEDQTVFIPEVHTTASDKVTGDHDGVVAEETTVLDEVFYRNLIPGKEYTVHGKLMVKETGEPLTVNGEEVTAEKTFTAEEADGSIILEFTFNSLALSGKHVVAFEDLTYEGVSIAGHEDLEDEDQTISYPELHTNAADQTSGSKTMTVGTVVTLVDTVTYKGLTKGKTYTVKGTIMDKGSGQPIGVTAETSFTAEETDGSTEVKFTFDTGLLQGKTLVVFEGLYDEKGNVIVTHNDLTDADQTVSVPAKPSVPPVITGDDSSPMPYVAALAVLLLAAAAVVLVLVKRRKKA